MFKKSLLALVSASALFLSFAPPAQAMAASAGTCIVTANFSFTSPIRASGTAPNFTVGISSTGTGCIVFTDTVHINVATGASGSGGASIWTCGATVASSSMQQSWSNSGGVPPPSVNGDFAIYGTPASWVAQLQSFNGPGVFLGVFHLVPNPSFPTQLSTCATSGISSLHMIGTEVFQDPSVP